MKNMKKALRTIDKPLFPYWQALYLSFFSSRLYVDVGKRWRGVGLLYLLLVIAVFAIPLITRVILSFNTFFIEEMVSPLQQLPPLYIQNGEISFDKPTPYFIHDKKGQVVATIDFTNNPDKLFTTNPNLTILITKNSLYFRPPKPTFFLAAVPEGAATVHKQAIDKNNNEVFIGKEWVKTSGITKLRWVTDFIFYPSVVLFLYVLYAVFLPALALLGQVFSTIFFKFPLRFLVACRLMIVAATPQIAVLLLLWACNLSFKGTGIMYLVLLSAYFSYGILALKRDSTQLASG